MPAGRRQSERSPKRQAAGSQRLQKALAAAGIASRRECEELILEGRVEVDRQVAQLGAQVDVTRQEIRVDGVSLPKPKRVYFLVNKPSGVVCTNRDPSGRTRVVDLVGSDERLFPVGRLDRSSEGAILVTNDGELANLLTHPRYGVDKVYHVRVAGHPSTEVLRRLRQGVRLAEAIARVKMVRVKKRYRESCDLEVVLNEGRNREIRRILARVGHKVLQLRRIAIGPLRLGDLPVGAHRRLNPREVQQLRQAAGRTRGKATQQAQTGKSTGRAKQPGGSSARAARRPATADGKRSGSKDRKRER